MTYEVAMALHPNGTFSRVNPANTIFSLYVHWYKGEGTRLSNRSFPDSLVTELKEQYMSAVHALNV